MDGNCLDLIRLQPMSLQHRIRYKVYPSQLRVKTAISANHAKSHSSPADPTVSAACHPEDYVLGVAPVPGCQWPLWVISYYMFSLFVLVGIIW